MRAAHGCIELGMFEKANAELEEIDPFCRSAPEVLTARVAIYQGLKKWDLMAIVAASSLNGIRKSWPLRSSRLCNAPRRIHPGRARHFGARRITAPHRANSSIQTSPVMKAQSGNMRLGEGQLETRHRAGARVSTAGAGRPVNQRGESGENPSATSRLAGMPNGTTRSEPPFLHRSSAARRALRSGSSNRQSRWESSASAEARSRFRPRCLATCPTDRDEVATSRGR